MKPGTPPAIGGAERSPFRQVTVVGCGLIGGSFALATSGLAGVERVVVTDQDPVARAAAAERGLEVAEDLGKAVRHSDLVVLAIPVEEIPSTAVYAASCMKSQSVLTDTGSVKARVVVDVEVELARAAASHREGPQFIGGHPMTGSEVEGIKAADGTLFQGATYVLTPTPRSSAESFNRLAAFVRLLGSRVLAVDPVTHDRLVAVVSHLPQVVASTLMRYAAEVAEADPGLLVLAGGGFRDVTRVAGSSPELWTGILRENRAALLEAVSGFTHVLDAVRTAVERDDWSAVGAMLSEGRRARARLPGKAAPQAVFDLVIPVEDRPGTLAEVTTALGAAGINIEDVSMRHAEEAGLGALVVAVAGEDAVKHAREVLGARGLGSHVEPR